jgi:hypothetical protein
MNEKQKKAKEKEIEYVVEDEIQTTTEKELTPRQILDKAEIDAETHYLVQMEGNHRESYKDAMDVPIHMHEKMKFIAIFTGETPVS